jgi:hypothetical protein
MKGEDLEGSNVEIVEVVSWHLPRGTEESHENHECKSRTLPLHHSAQSKCFNLFIEANKTYKILITQFSNLFLCRIFFTVDFSYFKFVRYNLEI